MQGYWPLLSLEKMELDMVVMGNILCAQHIISGHLQLAEPMLVQGKDRYPYPVGYHAVQAYNGNMCKMEIHEGPKGPLFMVGWQTALLTCDAYCFLVLIFSNTINYRSQNFCADYFC